jgi:anaerobic ribonucleoside-triphosphate reductase activating protein
MKYADIKPIDIANGPGVRVSFFVSGCRHKCPGCFNAQARDFTYGSDFTQATIDTVIAYLKPDHIAGLTLLGGEPLAPENQGELRNLIRQVREALPHKSIRCFSGFTYEFIEQYMVSRLPHTNDILSAIDVLVDGKRVEKLKNLNLRFRGSANQRVIDVQRTRKTGQIVRALGKIEQEKHMQLPLFTSADIPQREQEILQDVQNVQDVSSPITYTYA